MGKVFSPHQVKLITGIITSSEDIFNKAERALSRYFGPVDFKSQIIDFDFTDYYEKEMGKGLKRRFISFKKLIDPARLPRIKLLANRLEERLSQGKGQIKRAVNIDPGYITDAKLVLASTKDYNHRIYIDKGIYAEVTLYYQDDSFQAWGWTYPDYKSRYYITVFNQIRSIFIKQRR